MSDPDPSGNKTVFRPSPLQALKNGGQPPAPPPPPPPPPPPIVAPVSVAPSAAPPPSTGGGWRTALTIVFVVVTVLAIGYIVVQLTGTSPAVKTSLITPAVAPAPRAAA